MKVATLNNLKEFLSLMKKTFGEKETAIKHRNIINVHILNVDYTQLEFDTDLIVSGGASSSILGVGQVGVMILGS